MKNKLSFAFLIYILLHPFNSFSQKLSDSFNESISFEFHDPVSNDYTVPYHNMDFNFHTFIFQKPWYEDWVNVYNAFEVTLKVQIFDSESNFVEGFESSIKSNGGAYLGWHQDISTSKLLNLPYGAYTVYVYSDTVLVYTKKMIVREKPKVSNKKLPFTNFMYVVDYDEIRTENSSGEKTIVFNRGEKIRFLANLHLERTLLPQEKVIIKGYISRFIESKRVNFFVEFQHQIESNHDSTNYLLEIEIPTFNFPEEGRYQIGFEETESCKGFTVSYNLIVKL